MGWWVFVKSVVGPTPVGFCKGFLKTKSLYPVKRPYVQLSSPDRQNGERLVAIVWVDGWMGGFAKVDNRFGYEKWLQGGCKGLALL